MDYNEHRLKYDEEDTQKVWENLAKQRTKEMNLVARSPVYIANKDNLSGLKGSINLLQAIYSFDSSNLSMMGTSSELEGYSRIIDYFKGRTGRERCDEDNMLYLCDIHERLLEMKEKGSLSEKDSVLCSKLINRLEHPVLGVA